VIEEGSTRRCQFDTASAARQELHAYLVLKVSNLATERRLRRVQFSLCRHGQTSRLGDRNEIAKMSQFHFHSHASEASLSAVDSVSPNQCAEMPSVKMKR
jgi:hypothetical protein